MKKLFPVIVLGAALMGFMLGYASKPGMNPRPPAVLTGHFDDLSMIPSASAQENKSEVMPFGYGSPRQPTLAPDAPPTTYWNIDDIRKAHTELAEKAMKAAAEAGSGSSQSFGGGPVHISTRNFSIFMLYRLHRDQPVPSLTKVNSVWDDAEMHAGAYDFYVITGGTGEMIVGGKIANRQNLRDKDGIIPGEYRGQPVVGGQTYKVKAGDWLLIPPDTPHQPKPDPGGFSYMIMKINVGVYPWSLIR
ncbi:MAG TPA: AraC family ligand binding domain-containing protein [Candidatus Acidoferrum sp.]|jgi:mannose-6-phosphate isomerase-like protein (cupin superfamily)|nr:AraC family ligand binding domain-containing protein [Candidatus Acidoferrum sp.]